MANGDAERTIRHSPIASGFPLQATQVLENAQNGKGWLLAGVGMDLGPAPIGELACLRMPPRQLGGEISFARKFDPPEPDASDAATGVGHSAHRFAVVPITIGERYASEQPVGHADFVGVRERRQRGRQGGPRPCRPSARDRPALSGSTTARSSRRQLAPEPHSG